MAGHSSSIFGIPNPNPIRLYQVFGILPNRTRNLFKIGFPFYNMGSGHYSLAMGPGTLNETDVRKGDEPGFPQSWTVPSKSHTPLDPQPSNSTWPSWTFSLIQTLLYATNFSHPSCTSNFDLCYFACFSMPKTGSLNIQLIKRVNSFGKSIFNWDERSRVWVTRKIKYSAGFNTFWVLIFFVISASHLIFP